MIIRRAIIGAFCVFAVLAVLIQCIIDSSVENIACACIVFGSSLIVLLYVSWSDALETQPVSTFAIFGFCLTTQLGALLVQTILWVSLTKSLYNPLYTFLTLAFYQGIAIAVHATYRLFTQSKPRVGLFRGVLDSIGLYQTPSPGVLWLMGCTGIASYYASSFEGPFGKVADAFNFLIWAPFLIPIYINKLGDSYCNARLHTPCLVVHVAAVGLVALAVNARVILFEGVVTVALIYLLIGMRSNSRVHWPALAKMGAVGVLVLALSSPLSYLTTAMAIAHASRGKVPADVMIDKTIKILRRPSLIDAFRAQERAQSLYAKYDEHYISNPVVARFVETKFHDNALHFARMLTTPESREILRKVTIESLWFALPGPIIDLLDLKIKKAKKGLGLAASNGDYLYYLARGVPLGGYKTGSIFAQGMVLFGAFFPFVYALICVTLFGVMDLLTVNSDIDRPFSTGLAMMNTWRLFMYGITADGLDPPSFSFSLFLSNGSDLLPRVRSCKGTVA